MPDDDVSLDDLLILDQQAINRLKRDMGEDMAMVLDAYIESIDELLADIGGRTVRTPKDDLHRWAHSLKSSAATIGAMRLSHLARLMEQSYRHKLNMDVEAQLHLMQDEYRLVSVELEKLVID